MSGERKFKCSACQGQFTAEFFYATKHRSTGVTSNCKACSIASASQWRLQNRERHNAAKRRSNKRNGDTQKQWMANNRERMNEYMRQWRKSASPALPSAQVKHRKSCVVPPWADRNAIKSIYRLAKIARQTTGIDWEVDHEVPVLGRVVCGLHVETNLRLVPALKNRQKGNSYGE